MKINISWLNRSIKCKINKGITDEILIKKSNIELDLRSCWENIVFEDANFLKQIKNMENINIIFQK